MIRVSCMCVTTMTLCEYQVCVIIMTLWEYHVCMTMITLWEYYIWHWLTWWQGILWDTDKSIINSLLGRRPSHFTPCYGQIILRWQPNKNCMNKQTWIAYLDNQCMKIYKMNSIVYEMIVWIKYAMIFPCCNKLHFRSLTEKKLVTKLNGSFLTY